MAPVVPARVNPIVGEPGFCLIGSVRLPKVWSNTMSQCGCSPSSDGTLNWAASVSVRRAGRRATPTQLSVGDVLHDGQVVLIGGLPQTLRWPSLDTIAVRAG